MKTVAISFALKHGPHNKRTQPSKCAEQTPRPSSICGGCLWPHKLWKQVILSFKSMASRTALELQEDRTPRPRQHQNERLQQRLNGAWSPPRGIRSPSRGRGASQACVCGRMLGQNTWRLRGVLPWEPGDPGPPGCGGSQWGSVCPSATTDCGSQRAARVPLLRKPSPCIRPIQGIRAGGKEARQPGVKGGHASVSGGGFCMEGPRRYAHALIFCEPDFIWKKNLFKKMLFIFWLH